MGRGGDERKNRRGGRLGKKRRGREEESIV
jgi:hypothetical protein